MAKSFKIEFKISVAIKRKTYASNEFNERKLFKKSVKFDRLNRHRQNGILVQEHQFWRRFFYFLFHFKLYLLIKR